MRKWKSIEIHFRIQVSRIGPSGLRQFPIVMRVVVMTFFVMDQHGVELALHFDLVVRARLLHNLRGLKGAALQLADFGLFLLGFQIAFLVKHAGRLEALLQRAVHVVQALALGVADNSRAGLGWIGFVAEAIEVIFLLRLHLSLARPGADEQVNEGRPDPADHDGGAQRPDCDGCGLLLPPAVREVHRAVALLVDVVQIILEREVRRRCRTATATATQRFVRHARHVLGGT